MRIAVILIALVLAGCAQRERAEQPKNPNEVNCFWMGRLWVCD